MRKIKLPLILSTLLTLFFLAIYDTHNRYDNLRETMDVHGSIFQLVKLKSANAHWDFELNRVHSDNFPHFDQVNQAALQYEHEMLLLLNVSSNVHNNIKQIIKKLELLSSHKKARMNDYLSEVAVTRNSLKFIDTQLTTLHSQPIHNEAFLKFLAHARYRLSQLIALNQNIYLKQLPKLTQCETCTAEQSTSINTINQHFQILKRQIKLSHQAREAFFSTEHSDLLAQLFDELSLIYVTADNQHQTIQSQILAFTAILIFAILILLGLSYWLFRTIDVHRTAGITDPLTGLYNRKKLFESLEKLIPVHIKSHKKLALLFIDLDGFKYINDTFGHDVGDKLLQRLSTRLIGSVRKQDIIYRIGGDEFVVLIQELKTLSDAQHIADGLLKKCNKPYQLEDISCNVTLSIGISVFPDHAEYASELLKYADEAMYQSKSQGKSRVSMWNYA